MIRIVFYAPGDRAPVSTVVEPGRSVLIGRAPDVARLTGSLARDPGRVRTLCLSSERVSANHLLIDGGPDGVAVTDLGSRNGTSHRLPPHRSVTLHGAEIVLDLASSPDEGSLDDPESPRWTHAGEFARSLCESASRWLDALGADLIVRVAKEVRDGDALSLPLATGESLCVQTRMSATADLRAPRILESLARFVAEQNARIEEEQGHDGDFVLRSPRFRDAHRRVYEAALRGRRLLLLGASGTGKDRLAACYHMHSLRREGPFRALNCALMDKDLIWVQLFGASRGSYTGSVREVIGAVELANRGTLFLDEVAELSPRMQSALLRFLDRRGEFERLGEQRTRHTDVQIVCATNANLRAAVARGEFREDLWYRFAGSVVEVPALRDRPEDLEAFLAVRRQPNVCSAREQMSADAMKVLREHPWPGNFRELENFVARLPLDAAPGTLGAAACRALLTEGSVRVAEPADEGGPETGVSWATISEESLRAFRADHDGGPPRTYAELREFFEGYLRPVYVAHAAGCTSPNADPNAVNHSAIGRRLGIADGSTVRRCLDRYAERFGAR